jgi:hypothetical protein
MNLEDVNNDNEKVNFSTFENKICKDFAVVENKHF